MSEIKLGASTKAFGGKSVRETAELFAVNNLSCVELCFCLSDLPGWYHNLCGYEQLPTAEDVQRAVELFKSYNIEVCAIGVYSNLCDGNAQKVFDAQRLFSEYCNLAYLCGIKTLATFGGNTPIKYMRSISREAMKLKMYDGFCEALFEAKKRKLTLALDLCGSDTISSYEDYLSVKNYAAGELASFDNLKLIYDIESAYCDVDFDEISLCHIKDKKKNGVYFERYGTGDGDFSKIYKIAKEKPDIPLIFEYVNSENVGDTVANFRNNLEKHR